MTAEIVQIKRAPPGKRTKMDTLVLDLKTINSWHIPPFQRPVRINDKVRTLAERIKRDGGVVPGTLTLGVIEHGPEAGTYVTDGQHRIESFRLSETREGYADVRIVVHDSMADMGAEFVELNSQLVKMRPDDMLRGLENSVEALRFIRDKCSFVGYDNIRRGDHSPVLSMSAVMRAWNGSIAETPITGATSAAQIVRDLSADSVRQLVEFLAVAYSAWGRGCDVSRLWSNLSLILCMWLWRRLVLDTERRQKRYAVLRPEQFKRCLMSLAASSEYNDWLVGRNVSERDRSPCYERMRKIFMHRLSEDGVKNAKFPSVAWAKK